MFIRTDQTIFEKGYLPRGLCQPGVQRFLLLPQFCHSCMVSEERSIIFGTQLARRPTWMINVWMKCQTYEGIWILSWACFKRKNEIFPHQSLDLSIGYLYRRHKVDFIILYRNIEPKKKNQFLSILLFAFTFASFVKFNCPLELAPCPRYSSFLSNWRTTLIYDIIPPSWQLLLLDTSLIDNSYFHLL